MPRSSFYRAQNPPVLKPTTVPVHPTPPRALSAAEKEQVIIHEGIAKDAIEEIPTSELPPFLQSGNFFNVILVAAPPSESGFCQPT